MNSIIADKLRTEQTVSSRIDLFFRQITLSKLLKKSNFYKESGIPCAEILKTLFTLVFTDKNLYRALDTEPEGIGFKKNTAYRFLNSMRYNWTKLLTMTAAKAISTVNSATSEDRANVLIIDDSFYDRNRSKKVELLARVFDHSMHKYVKGFKMLTLGWSDGRSFIPVSFSLLSSRKESNVLCPSRNGIDRRTAAHRRRRLAISSATEVLFELLENARNLPAAYVLFDSWFAFPKTICRVCKTNYDVICMVKNTPNIHYGYNGQWISLSKLHDIVKKTCTKKDQILGSIEVSIRESKDSVETRNAKIIFIEDRSTKSFLAILSTNTAILDEEALRIYGKRWDIEVFFKMCKSYLSLCKEFQGRSYDMMTAHTTIVFMRYIMLSLEARNSVDHRTVGGLFYLICDEIEDIRFAEALSILLELLKRALAEFPVISEKMAETFLSSFFNSLPSAWKSKLQLSA